MAAREVWTPKQNRLFEVALSVHNRDTPDRWHNIARAVGGGKTADDVRRYYEQLVDEIALIEAANLPCRRPNVPLATAPDTTLYEAGRLKYLKMYVAL